MADRYPRYTPSNISLAGPGRIDQASLKESIRSSTALTEGANKIMNFAFKQMEDKAKIEGSGYGAKHSQKVLQQFEGRTPSSVYDQSAFASAIKVAGAKIETEARSNMGQSLLEWKQNKGDPEELKTRLNSIIGGFSNTIGRMDSESGFLLSEKLKRLSNSVYLDYSEDWMKEQEKLLDQDYITGLDERQRGIEVIARQDVTFDQFNENLNAEIASLQEFLQTHNVEPKEIGKEIVILKSLAHRARVRGEFERSDDKAGYLGQFTDDIDKRKSLARGLDEADIKTLQGEMSQIINKKNTELNTKITALDKEIDDVEKTIIRGMPSEGLAELEKRAIDLGEGANEVLGRITYLKNMQPVYESFANQSLKNMAIMVEDFNTKIREDNDVTGREREVLDNFNKMWSDAQTRINKKESLLSENLTGLSNIILKGKSVGDYLKQLKQDAIDIGSDEVLEEIKLLESVQPLFENLLQLDNESFLLTLNKIKKEWEKDGFSIKEDKTIENIEKLYSEIQTEKNTLKNIFADNLQDYEQTIVFGNINANELNDLYERAVELGGEDSESAKRIEQLMNESIEYSDARNKDYPDLVEEINKRELNIKNLDPSKKINERKIIANLEKIRSHRDKRRKELFADIADIDELTKSDQLVSENLLNEVIEEVHKIGDSDLIQKLMQTTSTNQYINALVTNPTINMYQEIINIKRTLSKDGFTIEENKFLEQLNSSLTAKRNALEQDPVNWVIKNNEEVTQNVFKYIQNAEGEDVITLDPDLLKSRIESMQNYESQLDRPTYLTNEETKILINQFENADIDSKMMMMGSINEAGGPYHSLAIWENIHGEGDDETANTIAHLGAILIETADTNFIRAVINGQELIDDKNRIYNELTTKDEINQIDLMFTSGINLPSYMHNTISKVALNAYTYYHKAEAKTDFDLEMYENLLQKAAGANGNFGGIIDYEPSRNGHKHKLLIPSTIPNDDRFEDFMDNISWPMLRMSSGDSDYYYANGQKAEWEDFTKRLHLTNAGVNEEGNFTFRVGFYPWNHGAGSQMFVDENGEDIILDLERLYSIFDDTRGWQN